MFKEENRIWWYMLGVIVMMVAVYIFGKDYVIPVVKGERPVIVDEPFIYDSPPRMSIDTSRNYIARIVTNYGTITVDLFENNAPKNVNNLIFLANQNFYDETKFYRVVQGLLVQAGDRNTLDMDRGNDGRGRIGYFIEDEVNWDSLNLSPAKRDQLSSMGYTSNQNLTSRKLDRYVMAMANSQPNTNGSHFFFVLAGDDDARVRELNGRFTVVGRVLSGADVLTAISNAPVDDAQSVNPHPKGDIVIRDFQIESH